MRELCRRFDHACCETTDSKWHGAEQALTITGLFKGKSGRRVKDDRHEINDRRNWVLGWDNPPTWYDSIQPVFQQYANLYPVMKHFIDLGNYEQVKNYAKMLARAFRLPEEDPNAMPVTRDLSPAKRAAILQWLTNPLEGTRPMKTTQTLLATRPETAAPNAVHPGARGGKTAALARRIGRR